MRLRTRGLSGVPRYAAAAALVTLVLVITAAAAPSKPVKVADRSVVDLAGGTLRLVDPKGKPTVVLFLSTECPMANAYSPRLVRLARAFAAQGVRLISVYPNAADSEEKIRRHAVERGYRFPAVKDNGTLARAFGAKVVPEAFVLDASGAIRYRGAIDNNKAADRVSRHFLRDAVQALLARRQVPVATTPAVGCAIQSGALAARPSATGVTYAEHIEPIFRANCLPCHRPGEVAPFSMHEPRQVALWAKQIAATVASGRMPPWKAESHGEFLNERRLSREQRQLVALWVEQGAPLGDTRRIPPLPRFSNGWQLGEPEEVIGLPEEYRLGPEGSDVYRCYVIPNTADADRYITAMEFRPGNRAVVHHMIAYLDTTGAARRLDAQDPAPGYTSNGAGPGFVPSGFLGGWAPGNEPTVLPAGVGILWPKGGDIVLEVHYHRNGKPETDRSTVGLHFAKEPIKKRLRIAALINPVFRIPAGAADHVVNAAAPFSRDITILGVTPHMHLLGKSVTVVAVMPGGQRRQLVHVPEWDFNWQTTYSFREPVRAPKGTTLRMRAVYDNSSSNPNNPSNPPREVRWGEQTTDEMCIAFIAYTLDEEALDEGVRVGAASLFEIGR